MSDDEVDITKGTTENRKNMNIFSCLVINLGSTWKGAFDILMLFVSCYNIFGNALYSAFGMSDSFTFMIVDQCVETMFLFDMFFCFCQEYLDEETYTVESDIKIIAKHYLSGSFFFDLVAWVPVDLILRLQNKNNEEAISPLWRLFKLLRMPRLAQLLDVDKCKNIVNSYYDK